LRAPLSGGRPGRNAREGRTPTSPAFITPQVNFNGGILPQRDANSAGKLRHMGCSSRSSRQVANGASLEENGAQE